MRRAAILIRVFPALLICALIASGNASGEGFKVVAIDVLGTRRASPDAVRQAMSTRVGQELDLDRIREDVKAIHRLGYFRNVNIDSEEAPGGFRLTVVVTEKPIVGSVAVEGVKEVDETKVREALTVKERSLFQEDKVKESVSKVREVCQNEGYYDAAVDSVVVEEADGSIRVTFRVVEGERQKIETIEVTGNLYFSRKQILKQMDVTEEGFFSFITQSGVIKRDVLENDIRKIEALYQNAGFLDSKVFDPQFRRAKKGLVLSIRVFEGKQYRLGEIRFSGESGISEETLRKTVKLKSGNLFSREVLVNDLLALTTLVNDQGYAQALVSPGVEKRKDYPVADVTYRFERGTKFRFGRVDVTGNTKTYDQVVRRRLGVADGQTYSATKLKESKEDLTRTSYFKDVKLTTVPSEKKPGEMDVKVEVQEAPTGTLSGGMGYSTMDGIFGVVQLSENNLFGRGWRSTLGSQFGSKRTTYTLDFTAPYFMDTDYTLLLNLYKTKIEYSTFEKDSTGGRIGAGRNLSRFVHASMQFGLDGTRIKERSDTDPSDIIQEEIDKGKQTTRSVIFNLSRNTTNRFIDPSKGTVYTSYLQWAGSPLGGDSRFLKYVLGAKGFYPVTEKTVFSANFTWGHVVPMYGGWGDGEVPLYERFFLGGPYSVRGFKARSISPENREGDDIGGNKELVVNFEYQFPLLEEAGFKGVFFFDMGNTWDQDKWPFVNQGLWMGYGIGVRWYSPMGPMRFEYGWNVDRPKGEPPGVFEFTIGTAF
jgi:outer membrane protein insertion porin family